ncbi:capsid protein [Bacillus cereus group sp. TH43LC]|uniref:Capsid protein n=2 Tax=Bacillus paranthracis TaxID=2026186 RepID=A0ABT6E296_9BACI|nr:MULTISPECIES: capsid protein [Bacillus cereus group]MCC2436349.1 capsid protein [Bacillus paranthracis]MDA1504921.1 capsid protein [Bacillus cereus group sp. TH43LC]MDA1541946.1 capsid protein [Bacillus cereus group sp. TH244-1LC]MDA1652651.1 capsid protein [Bacillus cereus group sp. TH160LC]MDA1802631.1 capsid protein [Bacillus cereus group sp. BY6-1LC]
MGKNQGFLLNHGYKFEINTATTPEVPAWERIAAGITSVDPDNNEESEETYYYDGGGAAERDITGFMLSYGFEGHRNYGDKAQDYIFSKTHKVGPERKTEFRVTEPNGDIWEGKATISEIKAPGGDANSKGEIEFTISFDGVPKFTKAVPAK